MRVVLLGTGTPNPSPEKFGPSVLVQVGKQNLLFDAGRGNPIRLWQLKVPLGSIDQVFMTHYHSDHVNGLADLWLTGWLDPVYGGREAPLNINGPVGLQALADGLQAAFVNNTEVRIADEKLSPQAIAFNVQEFAEAGGVVYDQDGITVVAFPNEHGEKIHPSVGYRIDYKGKSVVISGDTRPSQMVLDHAGEVDLLIHEVAAARPGLLEKSPRLKPILAHHTTPAQAAEIFKVSKPKLAVYTHYVVLADKEYAPMTLDEIEAETRAIYKGPLVMGRDLTAFEIGDDGIEVIPWKGTMMMDS